MRIFGRKSKLEVMFQRVIDKIHRMRMERLRARERKKQKAAEKKLSKLKAMKILTQKRLDNLRKKNGGGGGAGSLGATQLMQVCAINKTPNIYSLHWVLRLWVKRPIWV